MTVASAIGLGLVASLVLAGLTRHRHVRPDDDNEVSIAARELSVLQEDLAMGNIDPGQYAQLRERLAARLGAPPDGQGAAEQGGGAWRWAAGGLLAAGLVAAALIPAVGQRAPGATPTGNSSVDQGPDPGQQGLQDWTRAERELNRGNTRAAVASYRSAVAVLPRRVDLRTRFAVALARSGRRQEAVTQLRFAVRRAPRDAEARLFLGAVLVADGRRREAAEHWQRFLALSPNGPASNTVRRRLRALEQASGDRR